MVRLLIDGYNIVHAWEHFKKLNTENGFRDARIRLIDILEDYSGYSGMDITVVFDAHSREGRIRENFKQGNVDIIYTIEGETADQYIERWVSLNKKPYNTIMVATNDNLHQSTVFSLGAIRVTSRELQRDIRESSSKMKRDYIDRITPENTKLGDIFGSRVVNRLHEIVKQGESDVKKSDK